MASGGWIGKVVSGLFNWGSKSYTPQQVQQMRASDIVSSTQSAPPDAPVMGSDTEYEAKKRKKRGLMSLYVSQHGTERKDYTGRSEL